MEVEAAARPTVASLATNIDSHYMTMSMEDCIKSGLQSDVPFMAGRVAGEGAGPGFAEQMSWRSTYNKANQYAFKWSKVASGWQARGIKPGHTSDLSYIFNYPGTAPYYYLTGYIIDPATGQRPVIGDLNGNGVTGSAGDLADITTDAGWSAVDNSVADMAMTIWTNFALPKQGIPAQQPSPGRPIQRRMIRMWR
jgi:para-nitrobenzyl esterase